MLYIKRVKKVRLWKWAFKFAWEKLALLMHRSVIDGDTTSKKMINKHLLIKIVLSEYWDWVL